VLVEGRTETNKFGFSDNRAFYQIATDGGLLEAPVERTRLLLSPGKLCCRESSECAQHDCTFDEKKL